MPEIKRCPHCDSHLELVNSTLSWTRGRVLFQSWLCPGCGVRQETRRIGSGEEEVLLTSAPKAVVDAAENARMEQESLGHREFQSIGGRRNVRTLS